MSNRANSGPSGKGVFALMLLALAGVTAFGLYVRSTPDAAKVAPDLRREEPSKADAPAAQVKNPDPKPAPAESRYFVAVRAGSALRMARIEKPVPDGEDPKAFVTRETIQGLGLSTVQSRGVKLDGGTAVLDFNAAVRDGLGSSEEGDLLKALQMALGQFSDVDSIRIAVDGQVVEELGHVEVAEPLPVIRPSASP